MAEIRITLPDDKIDLLVNAANYHSRAAGGQVDMTAVEAREWLKNVLIENIRGMVKVYQQEMYDQNFVLEDPLE